MTAPRTSVVIASRIFEPEGGAAAFRLGAVARAVREAGLDLTVLTTRVPGLAERSSGDVRRWPVLRDRAGGVRGYVQYATFDVPLFFRLLFRKRPSVILVETPPTTGLAVLLASALRRTGYVYFAADILSTAAAGIGVNRFVVSALRRVEQLVLRRAKAVLAISAGVAAEVQSFGVASSRVIDVGTGIDTDTFTEAGPAAPTSGSTFVYAGTMSEIQGARVFVDAFLKVAADYPDARLRFFGRGTEESELRTAAAGCDRIEFHGQVTGEAVAAQLRSARAGLASVRPERGYDFAFATKAFTSIGCGTPVLYAGVGPARTAIEENGLGVTVDWDAEAVAAAMRSMLDSPREPSESARLSDWADQNVSLRSVAGRALPVLEAVAAGRLATTST